MWLDRLSAQSTPSATPPPPRGYSPAPRRPYPQTSTLPPRPSLNPRSSSLSLASPTSSTTSLPLAYQVSNSSSLRYQLNGNVHASITSPLRVLEHLFDGLPRNTSDPEEQAAEQGQKPRELAEDIDFNRLSLEDFATGNDILLRVPSAGTGTSAAEECRLCSKCFPNVGLLVCR
jgi:vacuolar protein sorting-associated protein 52